VIDNSAPVFVVGVPRSGTTVFSVKMSEATGITMSPETHFMPEVYAHLKHLDLSETKAVDSVLNRFCSGRWFADMALETGLIKDEFMQCEHRDWPALFTTILRLYAAKNGSSRWGEKTPGHYRFVAELLEWYSNCHVIFVIRDPRAVVASNLRAPFSPSYSWFVARRWREMWDIYKTHSADKRVSLIRYEDFVMDTERVLEDVKELLCVEAGPKVCEQTVSGGETELKGWREQHLQSAFGEVNPDAMERWREQLSPYDVWITEKYAGIDLVQCGYEPAGEEISPQIMSRLRFVAERSELAIGAAVRANESAGADINLKQRMLLFFGAFLDGSNWMLNRSVFRWCRNGARMDKRKRAFITLGNKYFSRSSYTRLETDAEVLGMFLISLCDRGYEVNLVASCQEQYLAAKKITRAFGLASKSRIEFSPHIKASPGNRIEIYVAGKAAPVLCEDELEIDALSAKEAAASIDLAVEKQVSGNDLKITGEKVEYS